MHPRDFTTFPGMFYSALCLHTDDSTALHDIRSTLGVTHACFGFTLSKLGDSSDHFDDHLTVMNWMLISFLFPLPFSFLLASTLTRTIHYN